MDRTQAITIIKTNTIFRDCWDSKGSHWLEMYQNIIEACNSVFSLLNIGVGNSGEAKMWLGFLGSIFPEISLFYNLEIDNGVAKKAKADGDIHMKNVEVGDVRKADEYFNDNSFDLIFWSHGPEHIKREEWKDTLEKLEKIATKAIILQCPWGSGYDFSADHLSKSIKRGEFEQFGYKTIYRGEENTRDADIFVWKTL